jgi:hypothetical protein
MFYENFLKQEAKLEKLTKKYLLIFKQYLPSDTFWLALMRSHPVPRLHLGSAKRKYWNSTNSETDFGKM